MQWMSIYSNISVPIIISFDVCVYVRRWRAAMWVRICTAGSTSYSVSTHNVALIVVAIFPPAFSLCFYVCWSSVYESPAYSYHHTCCITGAKQRGQNAADAMNVFVHLTYDGAVRNETTVHHNISYQLQTVFLSLPFNYSIPLTILYCNLSISSSWLSYCRWMLPRSQTPCSAPPPSPS